MKREVFAAIGTDRKLLSDSVAIVKREHVVPKATFSSDEMTGDYSESVSSGLWVPTTKVMRGYGIDTRNFCPTYDADIPTNLKPGTRYTSAGPN